MYAFTNYTKKINRNGFAIQKISFFLFWHDLIDSPFKVLPKQNCKRQKKAVQPTQHSR